MVYRTPYAKNPFDSVSDQEIEEYKRQVEMSQKGISGNILLSFLISQFGDAEFIGIIFIYLFLLQKSQNSATRQEPLPCSNLW